MRAQFRVEVYSALNRANLQVRTRRPRARRSAGSPRRTVCRGSCSSRLAQLLAARRLGREYRGPGKARIHKGNGVNKERIQFAPLNTTRPGLPPPGTRPRRIRESRIRFVGFVVRLRSVDSMASVLHSMASELLSTDPYLRAHRSPALPSIPGAGFNPITPSSTDRRPRSPPRES